MSVRIVRRVAETAACPATLSNVPVAGQRRLLALLALIAVPAAALGSVLDNDPFVPDTLFNGGLPVVETFHTPEDFDRPGRRVLRLANGDLVVAADIRLQAHAFDGSSIALARYLPDGGPMHWENASGDDMVADGMALVWPASVSGFPDNAVEHRVLDLKQIGDRILVLYARIHPTPVNHQIMLDVFDSWGGRMSRTTIHSAPVLPREAAMAPYRTSLLVPPGAEPGDRVLIAAPFNVGSSQTPQWQLDVARYRFADAQAAPQPDNDFNAGQFNRLYSLPASCSGQADARHGDDMKLAISHSVVTVTVPVTTPPRLYLANTLTRNGQDDVGVLAINASNSEPIGSFGSNTCSSGFRITGFNNGGSNNDRAAGISVVMQGSPRVPVIHVLASVDRDCAPGMGVARLLDNGNFDFAFGNLGRLVFGGRGYVGPNACLATRITHMPTALIHTQSNRLAIAGAMRSTGLSTPPVVSENPFVAILDGESGVVGDLRSLPVRVEAGGSRIGDGGFVDLVEDGENRLVLAGDVRDEREPEGWLRATLTRLVADRIFGNGLD